MIANLAGYWSFTEYPVPTGKEHLLDESRSIVIELNNNNNFDVIVPLPNGASALLSNLALLIDEQLRPTLSKIWEDSQGIYEYGLRLTFDIGDSGVEIVEGPLGSTIERWNKSTDPKIKRPFQPSDMGVITGTKPPLKTKRE